MRITQGEIVDLQTVLHIEMEDEDIAPYLDIGFRKVRPHIAYPGFRKGRVPRHIVMQFVGREALLNEVLDTMLPEVTGRAMDAQELVPGGMPNMEVLDLDPVTFKATVPLKPEVDLGDYRDIRVETNIAEVGEEDVQQRLEQLQNSIASWEPVERAIEMGDMVTMTATGTVGDETILDETDTVYLLAEDTELPFPGFSAALVGAELDTPKEFELVVADDYPDIDMIGKTVQISVTVSDVKEHILPDLDEEFAKGIGEGYDSLEELREQIESELKTESENAAEHDLRISAVESLLEGASVLIAPVIIDNEVNHLLNEQGQALARMNIRMGDYLRAVGSSEDEMRAQLREEAVGRIKRAVALEKLGVLEGIEVSDEQVEERIQTVIERNREQNPDASELPEITDEIRASIRRMLHLEMVEERLLAIVKGEAPELTKADDQGEASELTDADDRPEAEADGETKAEE